MLANCYGKKISLVNLNSGEKINEIDIQSEAVVSVAFNPDGNNIYESFDINELKLWNPLTIVAFTQTENHWNPVLVSSDFWSKFRYRHATYSKNYAQIWNSISSGACYFVPTALSSDRKVLARCFDEQPVQLWNLHTGEELGVINLNDGYYLLTLNSTGDVLASGNKYKITLWDVKSNTILSTVKHNLGWINQVVFSPDDKILAIASDNCKIKLWNLETNTEIKTLQGFSSIECLAFDSQEPILASGCSDGSITLWDLETFEEINRFIGHKEKITYLQFSPNGKFLASSDKRLIRLWKLTRSSS